MTIAAGARIRMGRHERPGNKPANRSVAFGTLAAILLAAPQVTIADDTMRCGSKIIHTGDGKDKVRSLCGEPTDIAFVGTIQRRTVPDNRSYDDNYYYGPAWAEMPVEVWTYNFGSSKLLRKLRFVGNELVNITTDGHGY